MNFRGRIGLFQSQTQARADTSPTRSFENCILCGRGKREGSGSLIFIWVAITMPLICFPPSLVASKARSNHRGGGKGSLGGKYGETTISKEVVYERLEPFELLKKSYGDQCQTTECPGLKCYVLFYNYVQFQDKNQLRIFRACCRCFLCTVRFIRLSNTWLKFPVSATVAESPISNPLKTPSDKPVHASGVFSSIPGSTRYSSAASAATGNAADDPMSTPSSGLNEVFFPGLFSQSCLVCKWFRFSNPDIGSE